MPAVTVKSLQASAAYLQMVLQSHNPSPNCKFLAERVVSHITIMLSSNKFKIPSMSNNSSPKETLDSGLIDVSKPAMQKQSNTDKVNITLLETRLSSMVLISQQIAVIEGFFRSYVSSSWTVRTYVNNDHNEDKARALLSDFDEVVDNVLMELAIGTDTDNDEDGITLFQLLIQIMNFLLPFLIITFVLVFILEKMHVFDDVEGLQKLQKHVNTFIHSLFNQDHAMRDF